MDWLSDKVTYWPVRLSSGQLKRIIWSLCLQRLPFFLGIPSRYYLLISFSTSHSSSSCNLWLDRLSYRQSILRPHGVSWPQNTYQNISSNAFISHQASCAKYFFLHLRSRAIPKNCVSQMWLTFIHRLCLIIIILHDAAGQQQTGKHNQLVNVNIELVVVSTFPMNNWC